MYFSGSTIQQLAYKRKVANVGHMRTINSHQYSKSSRQTLNLFSFLCGVVMNYSHTSTFPVLHKDIYTAVMISQHLHYPLMDECEDQTVTKVSDAIIFLTLTSLPDVTGGWMAVLIREGDLIMNKVTLIMLPSQTHYQHKQQQQHSVSLFITQVSNHNYYATHDCLFVCE